MRKKYTYDESGRYNGASPSNREGRWDKNDWNTPTMYEVTRSYEAKPKITLYHPRSMGDMPHFAEQMRGSYAILLNLEYLPLDLARRVLDTTSGIAYGMDYRIVQVSSRSYLIFPQQVELICA
jgi:FtsZ-interacting cell division protein YlmF